MFPHGNVGGKKVTVVVYRIMMDTGSLEYEFDHICSCNRKLQHKQVSIAHRLATVLTNKHGHRSLQSL